MIDYCLYMFIYIYIFHYLNQASLLPSSSSNSEVHKVKLSLINCMIVVASLYWDSSICSISAIASSKAYINEY